MKKLITSIAICLTILTSYSYSQQKDTIRKRNTIYFEIFGQGLINSINYDRLLVVNEKSTTSITIGFSHWGYLMSTSENKVTSTGIPISFNYLYGKNNHNLELGIGVTQMFTKIEMDMTSILSPLTSLFSEEITQIKSIDQISTTYFTPKIGYRYQQLNGGFCFRATLTPLIILRQIDNASANIGNDVSNFSTSSSLITDRSVKPWFGISFGYTF